MTTTLFRYFKSELLHKSQANEYLTVCDSKSANRKVKLEIDNSKTNKGYLSFVLNLCNNYIFGSLFLHPPLSHSLTGTQWIPVWSQLNIKSSGMSFMITSAQISFRKPSFCILNSAGSIISSLELFSSQSSFELAKI